MQRTLKTLALTIALSAASSSVVAQDFTFHWNPRSGDAWVDTWLQDINHYGYRYREPFIDEMVRYYDVPRDLVHDLIVDQRWAPGDVYYACAIAQIIGRPCRYVVDEWRQDHGQGWGALAQRLGIKPGSAEFHRLKRGFVPTYERWARPIVLDDELRRDFPGHKGNAAAADKGKGNNKGNKGDKGDKGEKGNKGNKAIRAKND